MIYRLKGERPTILDFLGMIRNVQCRGLRTNHATMSPTVFTDIVHSAPLGVGLPPVGVSEWMIYGLTIGLDPNLLSLIVFSNRKKVAYSLYNHYEIAEIVTLPTDEPYTILDWLEIHKGKDTQARV